MPFFDISIIIFNYKINRTDKYNSTNIKEKIKAIKLFVDKSFSSKLNLLIYIIKINLCYFLFILIIKIFNKKLL